MILFFRWDSLQKLDNLHKSAQSIARFAGVWVSRTDPDIAREVIRWASLLVASAATYLRHQKDYLMQHADVLSKEEMHWLLSTRRPPIAILQVITTLLANRQSQINPAELILLENNLEVIDLGITGCERIRDTAMPLAYTAHTSRFLIIYLTLLPFGIVGFLGWLAIIATFVIAFLLLGIEHAGIMLEQPFMVLPLSAMAASCRKAVEAVAITQLQVDELFPEGACLMQEDKYVGSATTKFEQVLKAPRNREKESP